MTTHLIDGFSMPTNVSIFDQIDKFSTIKFAKEKMVAFQTEWRAKHKSGGITSSTFDVFHAILQCIAPTMEDIRYKQPILFQEACQTGKLFAFVYLDTLATKINSLQDSAMSCMRLSKKTVYNQIKRLVEAGIIVEKNNYTCTGHQNPTKEDKNAKGRGKIQLYFDPKILKMKPMPSPSLAPNKQLLLQYSSSILKDKEQKQIIDNAPVVDNAVSAIADDVFLNVRSEGQGRKIAPTMQEIELKNKKDFAAWQQLNLCRSELFAMREMNATLEQKTFEIIKEHISLIEKEIQGYRAQKIKTYCDREAYKNSKFQTSMLKKYCEKLPGVERSAIEIFSHAVQKQAKHAKLNGYAHRIGCPPDFLLSPNFLKAIGYSVQDWKKIQDNYFVKNQRFGAYCSELGTIGRLYTSLLEVAHESISFAYSQAAIAYQNFKAKLHQNTALTDSNKSALEKIFKGKLEPVFRNLSNQDKSKILDSIRSN